MTDNIWKDQPKRWVDITLCIDATGSVADSEKGSLMLDRAKRFSLRLCTDIYDPMNRVGQCRIRVIAFRDYLADGEKAMMSTHFFLLPQQAAEFEACINSIQTEGGGDIPEDGLEALALAIRSPWLESPAFKRQVIIVWSDADTHALGFGSSSKFYPKGMPSNLGELSDWWDNDSVISQREKRLVLFTPDVGYWRFLSDNWECTWHFPSVLDGELDDTAYDQLLRLIMRN